MESDARVLDPLRRVGLRYELKLAGYAAGYARVRSLLNLHPAAIRELYPARRVQSVYFDSPFQHALEENLAGVSCRSKLRLRWYGAQTRGVRARLEEKVRENMLGWKHVWNLMRPIDVERAPRRVLGREVAAALAAGAGAVGRLDGLDPVQWIRYDREYLSTADGRVRITLDRNVKAFDQRLRNRLSSSFESPRKELLIVELKCAPEDHEVARELVAHLPLKVDRCSKFVWASDPAHGPEPSGLPL